MAIRVTYSDPNMGSADHQDGASAHAIEGTLQVLSADRAVLAEYAPGLWASWRTFGAPVEQVDPAVKELAGKVAADAGIDQARWGRFSVADLVAAYRQGRTDLTNTLNGALDEAGVARPKSSISDLAVGKLTAANLRWS